MHNMKVQSFTFNPFQENTYIIYDETKECLIIDPGCHTKKEENILQDFITNHSLNPVKLINTHCHIDHILGNKFVSDMWNIELYMHKADIPLLENAKSISALYGFNNYKLSPSPKHYLEDGDILKFGKNYFEVIYTPGHAPGHICLYNQENKLLIAGDVIFQTSIGRTDLPGGDYNTLMTSIKTKLLPLPKKTKIFCGHGPSTILEYEKQNNPFLN